MGVFTLPNSGDLNWQQQRTGGFVPVPADLVVPLQVLMLMPSELDEVCRYCRVTWSVLFIEGKRHFVVLCVSMQLYKSL